MTSDIIPDLYRTTFGTFPIPIFFRGIDGKYIGCNPAFELFTGKSRSEIIGKDSYDLFPRALAEKEVESDQEIVISGKAQRYEWHFDTPLGDIRDVYIDKAPIIDGTDSIVGISGAITDISGVRALENELANSTNRLESLLSALPVAIVIIDIDTHKIVDLNPLAMVMLGYTREQLINRDCHMYICREKADRCPLSDISSSLDRSESVLINSAGNQIPVLRSTIQTEIEGKGFLLECFQDISEQKELEYRLREMAEMDFLTGIFNRRHFIELALREISRSKRYQTPISLFMIDIDWFKKINDRYGHSAGDEVLKGVARICKESIRDIDIAGRFGGEEFAVVLVECSLDSAFTVAERIRANIESNEFPVDGTSIRCTVSIGIAGNTTEDADLEMVMKRADTALYDAKQAGRNRTCCFTTEERGRVSS